MLATATLRPTEPTTYVDDISIRSLADARSLFGAIGTRCRAVVQGRDDTIALVLIGLFADGHVAFSTPESGVSPGQACVLYETTDPHARVLGGGFIAQKSLN